MSKFLCWSCHGLYKRGDGISIDDTGNEQVCRKCWGTISADKRLWLGLGFRAFDNGGIGLKELFVRALSQETMFGQIGNPRKN